MRDTAVKPAPTTTAASVVRDAGADRGLSAREGAPSDVGLLHGRATGARALLGLQRSAGNAAVLALMRRGTVLQRAPTAGAGAAPAPAHPTLKLGDGPSTDVAKLQQALNAVAPIASPLRVTGVFDSDTQSAVKLFQMSNAPLQGTGVADTKTWAKLDVLAPRVVRQGRMVVLGPDKGAARGEPEQGTVHPTIKLGSKGPAVEELQQRLNNVPAGQVTIWLSTHGKFDKTTRIAVVEFQKSRKPALKANGVVGKSTWAALDQVTGAVAVGREQYEWGQRAEGTITGSKTAFTWRLLADRLQITVNIKFTGASKDPMVAQWRQDIANVWNSFKFVKKTGTNKELLLDFVVGTGSPADASVKVHKTPKNAKKVPRSDAANFHTGDKDKGLAPHEFGHLIGLQDEYNKGPEAYTVVTGEQPLFGDVDPATDKAGNAVPAKQVATEMRKAVSGPASTRGKRAVKVVRKYKLVQGGYAQQIALEYEKANAGKLLRQDFKNGVGYVNVKDANGTMGNDLAARIPGQFDDAPDEWEVLAPFLYTNRGIMGDMDELNNPTGLSAHDHPVAERHVRHFLEIVQSNKPGNWKLTRR